MRGGTGEIPGGREPEVHNIAENSLFRQVRFVRYADDFVVTARTREQLEAIKPTLEEWLKERGLVMHPDKTRTVSINDGFNFLGFSVRHYRGKCLVKPQKDKVLNFLREARQWLRNHKQVEAEHVIRHFNPILTGWANYYRHVVSKETFAYVSHEIWKALWRWCQRRHPNKGKDWVRRKYFGNRYGGSWHFQAETSTARGERKVLYLVNISYTPIVRHVKIKGTASPDDPTLTEYWSTRELQRQARLGRTRGSERKIHDAELDD